MITRRELNKVMSLAFASLFSGASSELLAVQAPPQQNSQDHGAPVRPSPPKPLIEEPLEALPESVASLLILNIPAHNPSSTRAFTGHQHSGPVFAYILEGTIENQVEPDPPKTYAAGDVFFEPTMHVHRMLRNLSETQPARILVFQIVPNGKAGAIAVK
ncbi:MAG: cupin domain-containing protein [Acidobacteriia bacterium]|nr:cupin domain-containing protein [Terriglobia bacterium]